ncbi:MAG: hypothetical protein GX577_12165 [Leptolinea sp.]|nr:hypothetical protein [Leptolinea sp.]
MSIENSEIKPDDTAPVVVDTLHEGKTMQVRIAPGNTKPIAENNLSMEETQNIGFNENTKGVEIPPSINPPTQPLKGKKPNRWKWVFVGFILLIAGGVIGGWFGYNRAIEARMAEQQNNIAMVTTTQFQLALQDQAEGRLETARKRLEYIVQLNPQFPGVTEKLSEVMMAQAVISTPTVIAIEPTPVPTKDTRNTEELFVQARQQAANNEWNNTITTLDALRQIDRSYRAIQIDGLYYIALRNRGIARINSGLLEQGIYDITMAGQYGPLDKDAVSYTQTASYYISGVAAWAVDWPRVLEFLASFYASAPGLRDASGMSAAERYRTGSILYGDELMNQEDPCSALYQFQNALTLSTDEVTQGKLTKATNQCNALNAPAEEEPTEVVPTDPGTEPPTGEPSEEPTLEPTLETTVEVTIGPTSEGT